MCRFFRWLKCKKSFSSRRYVNFEAERTNDTKHRFDQPACNGCGNCVSGCNTGAKNTLNMNYLPDAKVHGATFFTKVSAIKKFAFTFIPVCCY